MNSMIPTMLRGTFRSSFLFAAAVLSVMLAHSSEKKEAVPSAGVAVMFDGKPILRVQERMMSFSAEDRARAISGKIAALAQDVSLSPDAIQVHSGEGSMDIAIGDQVLMSITSRDAKAAGTSVEALAEHNTEIIRRSIRDYRRIHGPRQLIWAGVYTLLSVTFLVLFLLGLRRFYPLLYERIRQLEGRYVHNIRIQKTDLLTSEQITSLLISLAALSRVLVTALLLYFFVPLVFSFFPWTRSWSARLLIYIFDPLQSVGRAIVAYLPNLFFIVIVAGLVHILLKFVRMIFNEIKRGRVVISGFYPEWSDTTYKIVRFLTLILTIVMIFPYIPGSQSSAFKGISVFLGLLLSLGSTSAVANVMAGVLLTYMRPFKIGDRVKINDTVGDVSEKNLLVTRLRTIKNVDVTLPNSVVLAGAIINYSDQSRSEKLILQAKVSIGYDVPWRQVQDLLIAAAKKTPAILSTPEPFVLKTELDDFYVVYELNASTDSPHAMAGTISVLHENILDAFQKAGVQIMSPHFMAQPAKLVLPTAS